VVGQMFFFNVGLKVSVNRPVLKKKIDIRLVVSCCSLILAFPFCSWQFVYISGGFVLFFVQDSQNYKNIVLKTGLHLIQVLLKTGFAGRQQLI
jgi:hypothetical protein